MINDSELYALRSERSGGAMACGALRAASADYAVAISGGIAGSDGGTTEKSVGMVWFSFAAAQGDPFSQLMHFEGDRDAVRRQAVHFALITLLATFL